MTMAKTWETKNTATTVQMNRFVFMETSREKAPQKVRAGKRSRLPARGPSGRGAVRPSFPHGHDRSIRIHEARTNFPLRVAWKRPRGRRENVENLVGCERAARRLLHQRDDAGDVRRGHRGSGGARVERLVGRVDRTNARVVIRVIAV